MKRFKGFLFFVVLLCVLGVASSSFAAGRAMGILISDEEGTEYVLVKFDQNQFSQADAQAISQLLLALISDFELDEVLMISPDEMQAMGMGDADMVKNWLVAMGFDHLFIDVTMKPSPVPEVNNYNLDAYFYIASEGYDMYLLSIGIPEYWMDAFRVE